jgi:hypothetical protein
VPTRCSTTTRLSRSGVRRCRPCRRIGGKLLHDKLCVKADARARASTNPNRAELLRPRVDRRTRKSESAGELSGAHQLPRRTLLTQQLNDPLCNCLHVACVKPRHQHLARSPRHCPDLPSPSQTHQPPPIGHTTLPTSLFHAALLSLSRLRMPHLLDEPSPRSSMPQILFPPPSPDHLSSLNHSAQPLPTPLSSHRGVGGVGSGGASYLASRLGSQRRTPGLRIRG